VWIERDGIGALHPRKQMLRRWSQGRKRTVGAIHVQPQAMSLSDIGKVSMGSTAPVFVVPAFATMHNGRKPAARSASIRFSSSATSIRNDESVEID